MACFCRDTMDRLQDALPQLDAPAPAALPQEASGLQSIANWLGGAGLPAPPWQPQEEWRDLQLPSLPLAPAAMATISAFAQLRADTLQQLGIDLLVPGQASGLERLATTLAQRLSDSPTQPVNPRAWQQVSSALSAAQQVDDAMDQGILPSPPPGPPLAPWRSFLQPLRSLLPMIAAASQLGLDPSDAMASQLADMLRGMLRVAPPVLSPSSLTVISSVTAALYALSQIKLSLGVDPLEAGLPVVQSLTQQRLDATTQRMRSTLGVGPETVASLLPQTAYCPTSMATPAVVAAAAAMNPQALAAMNWQVPPASSLPVLSAGQPVVAFATQMNTALGLPASMSPCSGCDAAALMAAG